MKSKYKRINTEIYCESRHADMLVITYTCYTCNWSIGKTYVSSMLSSENTVLAHDQWMHNTVQICTTLSETSVPWNVNTYQIINIL